MKELDDPTHVIALYFGKLTYQMMTRLNPVSYEYVRVSEFNLRRQIQSNV